MGALYMVYSKSHIKHQIARRVKLLSLNYSKVVRNASAALASQVWKTHILAVKYEFRKKVTLMIDLQLRIAYDIFSVIFSRTQL